MSGTNRLLEAEARHSNFPLRDALCVAPRPVYCRSPVAHYIASGVPSVRQVGERGVWFAARSCDPLQTKAIAETSLASAGDGFGIKPPFLFGLRGQPNPEGRFRR